ncbi:MAG: efflux RND transporter periplasmic adaptor subunit [Proteobacteria bacterium]|nr:efflux RND transporter periplasmic adaptor subunit [Pseudomonadota bacterium]MDA1300559.1 efflux RND transporter periplasmic adaptor subunit [Pseudomonadota bacterium]
MPITRQALPAVICLVLIACTQEDSAPRPQRTELAPLVESVAARHGTLPLVERLTGTVRADNQVILFPEVSGRVTRVLVESGEQVQKGDLLVALSDQQYREQLRQADAGYRINEARVRQAQARLAELRAQASRTESLGRQDMVSQLELEQLKAKMESASADVALAQAQLEEAAATRAEREGLMAKTEVKAPISGVVGQRNAEVGMQVTPSTRLFTIGNLDRVSVTFSISDSMLRKIEVGHPVEILTNTSTGSQRVMGGELTRISPFLDEITRSAEAEIEVANPERWLRPGMFVAVDVLYGQSRQATLIPISALFSDPETGATGVFVLASPPAGEATSGTPAIDAAAEYESREVTFRGTNILARGAMEVAVDSISPGEWVVSLGQNLFAGRYDSIRVRPVTWQHVMVLQGLKREDLLGQILQPGVQQSAPNNGRRGDSE